MVKQEGGKVRSAYMMADLPEGASVPYMPMAHSREHIPPALGDVDHMDTLSRELMPADTDKDSPWLQDKPKIVLPAATRPSQSVTEIPGAAQLPIRIHEQGSFNPAKTTKSIRAGAMSRAAYEIDTPEAMPAEPAQLSTFPVIMWFLVGLIFPPFLLCGYRYIASANLTARIFARLSLFMFIVYLTVGLIVFASIWKSDAWNGEDPSCVRYSFGSGEIRHMNTPLGSAKSIEAYDPGVKTVQNISIYSKDCLWMGQLVVPETEMHKDAPVAKVLYIRMVTPGTQGDDFRVYARTIDEKINPAAAGAQAPARAWLEFSDPEQSNPWEPGSPEYEQNEPPECKVGMCKASYGQSSPLLGGAQYTLRVELNWYKYYMVVGVIAKTQEALERPFCVDMCVLKYIRQADGSWREPCAGGDITVCDEVECEFAVTRKQCLGDPSQLLL